MRRSCRWISLPMPLISSAMSATAFPSWSYTVYLVACSKPRMTVPLKHSARWAVQPGGTVRRYSQAVQSGGAMCKRPCIWWPAQSLDDRAPEHSIRRGSTARRYSQAVHYTWQCKHAVYSVPAQAKDDCPLNTRQNTAQAVQLGSTSGQYSQAVHIVFMACSKAR